MNKEFEFFLHSSVVLRCAGVVKFSVIRDLAQEGLRVRQVWVLISLTLSLTLNSMSCTVSSWAWSWNTWHRCLIKKLPSTVDRKATKSAMVELAMRTSWWVVGVSWSVSVFFLSDMLALSDSTSSRPLQAWRGTRPDTCHYTYQVKIFGEYHIEYTYHVSHVRIQTTYNLLERKTFSA